VTNPPLRQIRIAVGMRYRLIWAHARTRQGRIVVLALGALALATAAVLLGLGGLGAAATAVRAGRAGLVASVVLLGLQLNLLFAGVVLGVGGHVLSEATLRRYPLSRVSRLIVRHVTALLEPLWLLALAAVLGLAAGFSLMNAGSARIGVPVAVLFVISTYLLAAVATRIGEWLLSKTGGLLVALVAGMGLMMAAPLAPAWIARVSDRAGGLPLRWVLELTPPFAAAKAITAIEPSAAVGWASVLMVWCAALSALLTVVGRLPRQPRSIPGAVARWDHPIDRVAAMFPPALAPLAGKMLRYYLRSPQTRYNFPLALPVVGVMIATNARQGDGADAFLFALGAAPALGTLATGTFSMNVFGFDGHGFRRYFLLPLRAADILRTASLVNLIPGAIVLLLGLLAWLVLSPDRISPVEVAMLVSAGAGGLLLFNSLGTWTSIAAPRAIPFDMTFGNRLSPSANLLFISTMVVFFGLPMAMRAIGIDAVLRAWWMAPLFLAAAAVLHVTTISAGARALAARREQMLAAIEGR
jgi:hypothetical protein